MHYVWYLKRNILILQACILLSPQLVSEHSNDCENSCLERTGPRHDTRHSLYAMWSNVGRAASLATKHTQGRWSGEIIWIVSCCCLIMCTPSSQAKNGPWAVSEETGNSGPQVRWRAMSEFLPSAKQPSVWCRVMRVSLLTDGSPQF